MVRRVNRAVKRPASIALYQQESKIWRSFENFQEKKPIVDESESETKLRILSDISEYDESSTHESEDTEDSEGKNEGESKEKSESDSGNGEDKRDIRDREEDPLSLPICARDISVESYDLTTGWMIVAFFL